LIYVNLKSVQKIITENIIGGNSLWKIYFIIL